MKNKKLVIPILLILAIVIKPVFADGTSPNSSAEALAKAEDKAVINLTYQNGLLSADIKSASIKDIFEEIKKQTGTRPPTKSIPTPNNEPTDTGNSSGVMNQSNNNLVRGYTDNNGFGGGMDYEIEKEIQVQKVTISFKDKELTQAIKEILNTIGNPSYMLSYKKDKVGKYQVANINIRKRGSTEATQTGKGELREGEIMIGFEDGQYKIRAKNADVNELLARLSIYMEGGHDRIVADMVNKKIDFESGHKGIIILVDRIFEKVRPMIYKVIDISPEWDRQGNLVKAGYIQIAKFSDVEIRQRREQAQLKNAEGERLMKQGRYLEAEAVFGNIADPDYINSAINLGNIYLLNRNYPNAIGYFNAALEIDSTNAEALLGLGETYEKTDQREKALETLEKYALIEKNKQKLEEAKRKIVNLKDSKTENYYSSLRKGDEYRSKREIIKAKEEYEKSIKERPDLTSPYKRLAEIYESTKELEKLAEMYKKVIEIDEKDFDVYFKLGYVYANAGKTKEAIETFEKLPKVYPDKSGVMKARVDQIIEGLKRGKK